MSFQRKPRSSLARKPAKIAVSNSGRRGPSRWAMMAPISAGGGDVNSDLELALAASVGADAPTTLEIAHDVLCHEPALLRVGENAAERGHYLAYHGGGTILGK